ncbi:MAG: hypothetical protein JXR58_12870, partial [Bacteroidales bacterium]|nr:hypothetical protein [Bacteroidales bacterium]
TGRAEENGKTILFYTEKELFAKQAIEKMMDYDIPKIDFPDDITIVNDLIPEEMDEIPDKIKIKQKKDSEKGEAFHEKSKKNQKTNQGGSYLRKMKQYKKPQSRGDKIANRKKNR